MYPSFSHLKGKRVLVTRAEAQAGTDIEVLKKAGAIPINIPLIEICEPSDGYASIDRAIADIASYSWIAFTSANAVAAFFSRLGDRAIPKEIEFAAVGPATASALEERSINASVVAVKHDSKGLLDAMLPNIRNGERFLFPRALEGREELIEGLRARGAEVDVVEAYRTMMPVGIDRSRLKALIDRKEIDAVLFASPSAVRNFVEIVGEKSASEFLRYGEFIPIGETTAEAIDQAIPRPA